MDDQNLDQLLARRRKMPLPRLPASFQQDVWRAIRRRKAVLAEAPRAWLGWLVEPLFRPAMLFGAFTLAVVLGVGVGSAGFGQRAEKTRRALDLQVFGSASPALPATLMGHTK